MKTLDKSRPSPNYLMITVVSLGQQCLIHFEDDPIKQSPIQTFGHGITSGYSLKKKSADNMLPPFTQSCFKAVFSINSAFTKFAWRSKVVKTVIDGKIVQTMNRIIIPCFCLKVVSKLSIMSIQHCKF